MNVSDKIDEITWAVDVCEHAISVENDVLIPVREMVSLLMEYRSLIEAQEKAEPVAYEGQIIFQSGEGAGWSRISKEMFYKFFDETGGYSGVTKLGTKIELRKLYIEPPTTPTGVAQAPIDERAVFEKWANEHKGGEPLQLGDGGTYPNPFANAAFEAWQARAKLSQSKGECSAVVPGEIKTSPFMCLSDRRYANGWNDCRAAMLKGEK